MSDVAMPHTVFPQEHDHNSTGVNQGHSDNMKNGKSDHDQPTDQGIDSYEMECVS